MSWCFEDETSAYADSVLDVLMTDEAVVPSIWALEVANVLRVGEWRDRLSPADSLRFTALLRSLPISVDNEASDQTRVFDRVLSLARSADCSSYDAAYLELALRLGSPLATIDERLRAAAGRLGVTMLEA